MINLGRACLILCSLTAIFLQFGCASKIQIYNSRSDFENSFSSNSADSEVSFARAWAIFEKNYPDVYEKLFPKADFKAQERKTIDVEKLRAALPSLKERILSFYSSADSVIKNQLERFLTVFPDLKNRTDVFVIPSLLTFNGKVVELDLHRPRGTEYRKE